MIKKKLTPMLGFVIPVFNEGTNFVQTIEAINNICAVLPCTLEIIIVDDGSTDLTWDTVTELSKIYPTVKGIRLSRNFGKDCAIFVGLREINCDACITIDSDGQHPVELIPTMIDKWADGAFIVNAVKVYDSKAKRSITDIRSKLFNRLVSRLTGVSSEGASDYKLLDRRVVDILKNYESGNTIYRFMVSSLGFRNENIAMKVKEADRSSRWSFHKLVILAVRILMFHTNIPLLAFIFMIAGTAILCVVLLIALIIALVNGTVPDGYSTILVLEILTLFVSVSGMAGLSVYLKGATDILSRRSSELVWERTHE